MNHFMARLIFCFFAEDTDIFTGRRLFTDTVAKMSAPDASNTHEVISILFRAMSATNEEREAAGLPRWSKDLPYVNGGLFSGNMDVPRFSKIARLPAPYRKPRLDPDQPGHLRLDDPGRHRR